MKYKHAVYVNYANYKFESCPDHGSMLPKRIEGLLPLAKNMTARKDEQPSQVVEWRHTLELLVKSNGTLR